MLATAMNRNRLRRPIPWRRMECLALVGTLALPLAAFGQGRGAWGGARLEASEIARRYRDSVATISVELSGRGRRQGTGFLLEQGYLVTALHVIDGARSVRIDGPDGRRSELIVVQAIDVENDVALLEIEDLGLTPVPLEAGGHASVGDRVTVISNPLWLPQTITEGIVSGLREAGDPERTEQALLATLVPERLLQISAPLAPGSSGGPVFVDSGELVGVAVAGVFYGASGLNFAIPADVVPPLLEQRRGLDLGTFRDRVDDARVRLARPHLLDAQLAFELGDHERAEHHLARALGIHPDLLEALILKSELHVDDGDLQAARDVLLRATENDPESVDAWAHLGRVYHQIGTRRDLERALQCFEEALELDGRHAGSAFGLGELRFELGLYTSAIRALEVAFEVEPAHLDAGTRLGEAYLMIGRLPAAKEVLEEVLSTDSGWAVAHQVLARVYQRQGLQGEAQRHFGEFLDLSEGDPELDRLRERTIQFLRRNPHLIPYRLRQEVAED